MSAAEVPSQDCAGETLCATCGAGFEKTRKDKRYCSKACARVASRNNNRGPRQIEDKERARWHYGRAAWLLHDLYRLPKREQRRMGQAILEAASGPDPALRNILTDPALLGAPYGSTKGLLETDHGKPNIAKFMNTFCREEYGTSIRDTILDEGKPAWRTFTTGEPLCISKVPPHIHEKTPEVLERITIAELRQRFPMGRTQEQRQYAA